MLLLDFLEEKGVTHCPHIMFQPRMVFYWLMFSTNILSVSRYITIDTQDRRFYLNDVLLLQDLTKMVSDSYPGTGMLVSYTSSINKESPAHDKPM